MNYSIETMLIWAVAWILIYIACGVGSACAGGGFAWGFFFGPFGIIVAAIRSEGEKTRQQLQRMATSLAPAHSGTKLQITRKPRVVECKHCHAKLTDIPGPGTYECPECSSYVEVA